MQNSGHGQKGETDDDDNDDGDDDDDEASVKCVKIPSELASCPLVSLIRD